jgi:dimethylargininase
MASPQGGGADAWCGYTHALVRGLPASFLDALTMHPPPVPIDVAAAHTQHEEYNALLRSLVPTVVEVPADEGCPDCVFIEDTLLAIGPCLVATQPGAPERRPEVAPVSDAARQLLAGLPPAHGRSLSSLSGGALLDGGDVMFDGSCVWCGVSARSNAEAAAALAEALAPAGIPVAPITVTDPNGATLHLKSIVSALASHHILVADSAAGRVMVEAARASPVLRAGWAAAGVSDIRVTIVPDALCANVLRIGANVVMQKGGSWRAGPGGRACACTCTRSQTRVRVARTRTTHSSPSRATHNATNRCVPTARPQASPPARPSSARCATSSASRSTRST